MGIAATALGRRDTRLLFEKAQFLPYSYPTFTLLLPYRLAKELATHFKA